MLFLCLEGLAEPACFVRKLVVGERHAPSTDPRVPSTGSRRLVVSGDPRSNDYPIPGISTAYIMWSSSKLDKSGGANTPHHIRGGRQGGSAGRRGRRRRRAACAASFPFWGRPPFSETGFENAQYLSGMVVQVSSTMIQRYAGGPLPPDWILFSNSQFLPVG